VDSLDHLRARLEELIAAKLARIDALRAEIASLEAELLQAEGLLDQWARFDALPTVPPPARRVDRFPRAAPAPPVLVFAEVAALLERHGPMTKRAICKHFGYDDERKGLGLRYWATAGKLVHYPNGEYGLPPAARSEEAS